MSTRCRIGIENKDGTITSIYCHHDGYLECVGDKLVNHYKDENKIRALLELGDMSSLGTEPFDNPHAWETPKMGDDWMKKFAELHPEDMCDTYKSRGEDCPKSTVANLEKYRKQTFDCWGEYGYLFKDGKWFYFRSEKDRLKLVK